MFKGFQIKLSRSDIVSERHCRYALDDRGELLLAGRAIKKSFADATHDLLGAMDFNSGKVDINGNKLEATWFPKGDYDVFLSHSHADEELALMLAGRLKRDLGIRTFIDSNVWQHRKGLVDCLVKATKQTEDCELDAVVAHVDCMLSKSLIEMIDSCECLMFLNTPQSVSLIDGATFSPWLYTELEISRYIRKKPHNWKAQMLVANESHSDASGFFMRYKIDCDHLNKIGAEDFVTWIKKCKGERLSGYDALDRLYRLRNEE